MIFDIYEQDDLFDIAQCRRQATLIDWLNINHISFITNTKGRILAHKCAVDTALGVSLPSTEQPKSRVTLGYGNAPTKKEREQ